MNLVYLAKPIYGGWINFTVHLSLITGSPIYKTTKRSEKKKKKFWIRFTISKFIYR